MTDDELQAAAIDADRRVTALARFAARRRETLTRFDQNAYLDGLEDIPTEVVEHVCDEMGLEEPGEREPRFPTLGAIRKRCLARRAALRTAERQKALPAPVYRDKPVDAERVKRFKAEVAKAIKGVK